MPNSVIFIRARRDSARSQPAWKSRAKMKAEDHTSPLAKDSIPLALLLGRVCPALICRQSPLVVVHGPEHVPAHAPQPTNVTLEEAEDYQPFVEQAGNQANFPNTTGTNSFALTGTVVRYLAIGGAPLSPLSTNATSKAHSGHGTCKGHFDPFYPQTCARRGHGRNSQHCSAGCFLPDDA